MNIFSNLYNSFDEFYDTFLRGNEIEFIYKNTKYSILPLYNNEIANEVIGVEVCEFESDNVIRCLSRLELYNAIINGDPFHEILCNIEITWNNI